MTTMRTFDSIRAVHVVRAAKQLVLAGLAGLGLALLALLAGPASPAAAATVTIDLYVVAGTTTLPGGQVVPVLGYSTTNAPVDRPGGPLIVATEGDTVEVTVHNELSTTTALLVQGQQMPPDLTGIAPGATKTYSFVADQAGTFLYESGLAPNTQYQTAMGLHGALVVRPANAGQAYADAATAFDTEGVLVMSEIDPALNNTADPSTFDMRKFAPRYTMLNGLAHPDTEPITAAGGDTVLLRYVNAGIQYRSMGVLGTTQTVIGLDGSALGHPVRYAAETIGPGQTADALVLAPAAAEEDQALSVYDASMLLHNSNTAGFGGMYTSINIPGTGPAADTTGPITSAAAYDGTTLSATVDDSARGNNVVAAAEYFVDTLGAPGSGTAMSGAFGSPTEAVSGPLAIGPGKHVVYVRGQDADGNWGGLTSVLVTGADVGGPSTFSPRLAPRVTNHSSPDVAVSATGDDSASGNSTVTGAEYFIDTQGTDGSGVVMTVNTASPVASLDGVIPAAVVNGLPEGDHPIWIHSQDSQGNWGAPVTVNLTVDITGPAASGITVNPSPNNGTLKFNSTVNGVRVVAQTLSDPITGSVNSTIKKAEMFIDTVGANGSGIPMIASDGLFDGSSEGGYADIPLSTVKQMANGPHTIYVHAKDSAGNWGSPGTGTLVVDKAAPTLTSVSISPNPSGGAVSLTLSGTATDTQSAPAAIEWFIGNNDPGPGQGQKVSALSVTGTGPYTVTGQMDVSQLTNGLKQGRFRVRDAAGNWSAVRQANFRITGAALIANLNGAATPDLVSQGATLPKRAKLDAFSLRGSTSYVSFADRTKLKKAGTVQDEDVVKFAKGRWRTWFDGSRYGLTRGGHDLDAIQVVGKKLYFSTKGSVSIRGVKGRGDDADIYLWKGRSIKRVWDASRQGLGKSADVDAIARGAGGELYVSFTKATRVPGLGKVSGDATLRVVGKSWSLEREGR